MQFSFVLLTWNRYQFLEKCLEALTGSIGDPGSCEILVLDNGSTDETPGVLERYRQRPNFRVITRTRNKGIDEYRKLFRMAKGTYIVVVDDDVLEMPPAIDSLFADYMQVFPDYGYLALNVVQNEFTNGAKPGPENYVEEQREGKTVDRGPTGGWCSCFRRRDYKKLWFKMLFARFDFRKGEDGFLAGNFERWLSLKSGIIHDAVCFHASGPYYASQYGHLDREIEKYRAAHLENFAADYSAYRKDQ